MPAISLIVCLHGQREFLQRLLQSATDCHDELLVVHDGPDETNIRAVVEKHGGRFFERDRAFQQEPHWPFAWEQAKHDWILRLDADEVIGNELSKWLKDFKKSADPPISVSGYECFWPMWNGATTISRKWPGGRNFLFHKQRVRFFGMVEQVPVPDSKFVHLDLALQHQPRRRSHSLWNVLVRKQAYIWRNVIARSLLGKPTDLSRWRWDDSNWPETWEQIRKRPLRTAIRRLLLEYLRTLRGQWRLEGRIYPVAALNGPIHHALICLRYWQLCRKQRVMS